MATTGAPTLCVATTRPCISFPPGMFNPGRKDFNMERKDEHWTKLRSSGHISSRQVITQGFASRPRKFVTRATMPEANETKHVSGLAIDLRGKRAFIAGVGDDGGYGWAIAKSLAAAGAEILIGSWVPIAKIFQQNLLRGKFDKSRILPDGSLMDIVKVYPFDAHYDNPEDVPENIKTNRRYVGFSNWTVREVAECVKQDFGSIDILVHSIGNATEVTKPLLQTSRKGYIGAISASSFSHLSLMQHFIPIMNQGGASLSISYVASTRMIPNGGMSSAKAALESDTRALAYEAGRMKKIRVNAISAENRIIITCPGLADHRTDILQRLLMTRAAKAIGGSVSGYINYSLANAPLQKYLAAGEVGDVAAFLLSPLASAVTGSVVFVDNGLNIMGVSVDNPAFESSRN